MSSTPIIRSRNPSSNRAAALLVALALALLVVAFFVVRPKGTPGPAMRDFEAYYAAGRVANRGADPYSRAIWQAEQEIPGVDVSHDETLPFVGPAAGLPLWRFLALFPFDVAGRIWGAILALAMLAVVFGSVVLARAPRQPQILLGAAIFAGAFGPLTSDVALGQVALVGGAAVVAALVLLQTRAWPLAGIATACAALQPNLALVLLARLGELRTWLAFAFGFAIFVALTLGNGGVAGLVHYVWLLKAHGDAERTIAIQIAPAAIALGLGANETLAVAVRVACGLGAFSLVVAALRRIADPAARVGIAVCALPFIVPFFHEHDFSLAILPAIVCAVRARGATLGFAAVTAVACGVDWLGLGQRPEAQMQSVVLALTAALGFTLVAGLQRAALAGLAVPLAVAAVALVARLHPVPIWPDALPPHWQPPADASVTRVWELEQRATGLSRPQAVWAALRAISLASSALLGWALFLAAAQPRERSDVDVEEVVERRQRVGMEAG